MKKLYFLKNIWKIDIIVILVFLISFNLNALTMKEKIEEDLSKMGISKTIISETTSLYKQYFENENFYYNDEVENKIKKLLKKDKKNFYLSEILIYHHVMKELYLEEIDKKSIEKYLDLYKKYSPYNYRKYYHMAHIERDKTAINKMKQEYLGTIFEKYAIILERIIKGDTNEIDKLTKEDSKLADEILVEIKRQDIQAKFRLSEEEVFDIKNAINQIKILNYFSNKEYEKGIDYYLNIENKRESKFKKYKLIEQQLMWLVVASKIGEMETLEKATDKIKKLEKLEIYNSIR